MNIIDYIAILLAIASVGLAVWEIVLYRKRSRDTGTRSFARHRLVRRLIGVVLLLIAVGMVFIGDIMMGPGKQPGYMLIYWGICLVCALGVFVVVVIDLKHTAQEILAYEERLMNDTFLSQHNRQEIESETGDEL